MATRADVARAAGVSPSTVSYVISGDRPVSEATRRRVEDAIQRLCYVPNAKAGNLAARRLRTISVHVDIEQSGIDTIAVEYVKGMIDRARELGLTLIVPATAGRNPDEFRRFLRSRLVDGVIYMDVVSGDWRESVLLEENYPAVALGYSGVIGGVPYVESDFAAMGELAVRRCMEYGHRRAVVISRDEQRADLRRTVGITRDAIVSCARAAHMHITVLVLPAHPHSAAAILPALTAAEQALQQEMEGRATVVIADNIPAAVGLVDVARQRGIELARDYSMVSVAGQAVYDVERHCALSEVGTDRLSMGRSCVDSIVQVYTVGVEQRSSVPNVMASPIFIDRGTLVHPSICI
ncbi:MAG: LacI family DNA-binding transcriptional regulator [Actinomycetaceae bacterium]|nr:LacI family transcriptional regulator [Arcanobacterium sp.]MDD7687718.1 LacI family DNA-binding transcriptional regulator [Actinomycetaceae bacterium]MDY5274241.1 LacI family DNA-binding transcriptional regulator [Arcanobacterium sp.]